MNRSEAIPPGPVEEVPTAAERVANQMWWMRIMWGDHASLAAAMTGLGLPTHPSTLSRIESGKQAPTLDETLMLGMLRGGLAPLLGLPFRVGDTLITSEDDLRALFGILDDTPDPPDNARTKARAIVESFQARRLALALDVETWVVSAAVEQLFGRPMIDEISARVTVRTRYLPPGGANWQAIRTRVVREVRREIADRIEETS